MMEAIRFLLMKAIRIRRKQAGREQANLPIRPAVMAIHPCLCFIAMPGFLDLRQRSVLRKDGIIPDRITMQEPI